MKASLLDSTRSGPATADPERAALVDRARREWISKLIDTSRNNNLLYFRSLKVGTMEFSHADPNELAALLRGDAVPVMELVGSEEAERREEREGELAEGDEITAEGLEASGLEQRIATRVRAIQRKAVENHEEKGLDTLHLVIGMAAWRADDGGRPPESPVLLVPVQAQSRGSQARAYKLQRSGDVQINPVLLHALEESFGVRLATEDLLAGVPGIEEEAEEFDPEPIFARLRAAAEPVPGFELRHRVVLGNFAFAKMAMVKDLREHAEALRSHEVIAAVAGHDPSRQSLRPSGADPDPRTFDEIDPAAEYLILDADSSQHQVIAQVLAGRSGVVQGPPGTGKSQTIANLIAELASRREPTLFVAEKRAALEVVHNRLERAGLGHLVLDLHGSGVSRKEVMRRVAAALNGLREVLPVDAKACHRELVKQRSRLNDHARRMHVPRAPAGRGVFDLQGEILLTPPEATVATRWRASELDQLTADSAERIVDLLEEAAGFEGLLLRDDPSPWTGAQLEDAEQVREALDLVATLANDLLPRLSAELGSALRATGLPAPATLSALDAAASLIGDVSETVGRYGEGIHAEPLDSLAGSLAPAAGGGFPAVWAFLTSGAYRAARSALLARRTAGPAPAAVLLADVQRAARESARWAELAPGSAPRAAANAAALVEAAGAVKAGVRRLHALLPRPELADPRLDELTDLLGGLTADRVTPHRIPKLLDLETRLGGLGAGALVGELRTKRMPAPYWPAAFRFAWYSSTLDRAWAGDPDLPAFDGRTHDAHAEGFKASDRARIEMASDRVKREHAEHVVRVMNQFPEQESVVRAEALKKSRHMPLRSLLEQAPDVLTALFPCWMASPLSVSQLLDGKRRYFQIAIFDEASQVQPEDAIPSLLRAQRLVVAGDRHQLPPTAFFADGAAPSQDDDPAQAGATGGFESLLDTIDSFMPSWMLQWHYRSRDEALIAFSNRHIYDDRLITFPGPGRTPAISHVHVEHVAGQDGQEESAAREVERVVEMILEHAERRPTETLGVIALGIKHAKRIQMALDAILPLRPDLETFFDQSSEERFFVKNLERVQGDERDAIILSVGYGKNRAGALPYSFGPILQNGGERRLNVAVTRARSRMTVISSFTHHDMDPGRSTARGVEFLRQYLQYAASAGSLLGEQASAPVAVNSFEADIKGALEARGIPLTPQYGCSSYRIDLVARHRERPGRFVLAIECDGATYHSSPTARDRDRLRQQMLEGLGWRFHRIWSTDWFLRRDQEIERAVRAYEDAVAHADRLDAADGRAAEPRPASAPPEPEAPVDDAPGRAPRPQIPLRESITEYSPRELDALVCWIRSDHRLRTDDEIVTELSRELQFTRKGRRIVDAIVAAIRRVE